MPDKRLRGSTQYSTNPATMRARKRINIMDPQKRQEYNDRIKEYTSMWATCARVARRDEYRRASVQVRRNMLFSNINAVIEKRRKAGKTVCGLDPETMIERHLKKEADMRACQRGTKDVKLCLKGIALDSRDRPQEEHAREEPLSDTAGHEDGLGSVDPAFEDWLMDEKPDDGLNFQMATQGIGVDVAEDGTGQMGTGAYLDDMTAQDGIPANKDISGQDTMTTRRNRTARPSPYVGLATLRNQLTELTAEQQQHSRKVLRDMDMLHHKLDRLAEGLETIDRRLAPPQPRHFDPRVGPHPGVPPHEYRRSMFVNPRGPGPYNAHPFSGAMPGGYGSTAGMHQGQTTGEFPTQHRSSFPMGGQGFPASFAPRQTERQAPMSNEQSMQYHIQTSDNPGEANNEASTQANSDPIVGQPSQASAPTEKQTTPEIPEPAEVNPTENTDTSQTWMPPPPHPIGVTTPFLYSPAAPPPFREQPAPPMDPRLGTLWEEEQQEQPN